MRKLAVLVLILALVYPVCWAFAQDQKTVSWEEHLSLAKNHALAQIAVRQTQIQRLTDQIEVWKDQLKNINLELEKIKEQKNIEKPKTK